MKNLISSLLIVLLITGNILADGNKIRDKYLKKPDTIKPRSAVNVTPPPRADETISPAEFSRAYGVYLSWSNDTSLQPILRDIAREVTKDDTLYMALATGQESLATKYFTDNQITMDKVKFISTGSIDLSLWIRDFGPFYIYEDGLRAITNYYYWYAEYDTFPHLIADHWDFNCYDGIVMLSGGNFMTDGNGMGFFGSVILTENNTWSEDSLRKNLRQYLGLDSIVFVRSMQRDGTGHIDMAQKLLNDTLILVGEYVNPGDGYGQNQMILNKNADSLSKMKNLDGRPFNVVRIPMPPFYQVGTDLYAPSYTNSLIINKKVLVPIYGDTLVNLDTIALNIYKKYMPDYEVIGIMSAEIIKSWGAVHCITKTHFHSNPMMVLHDPLDSVDLNEIPVVRFRLNPGFDTLSAKVFHKPRSGANFTEFTALLDKGVFSATLPPATENFNYYIEGTAKSGSVVFPVSLPVDAPANSFFTIVRGTSINQGIAVNNYIKLSNYPNPFNAQTTISYTVKKNSRVRLDVYNLRGRKVHSLAKGFHKAGSYKTVWHGMNKSGEKISSGVYYLIITIINNEIGTITKKNEMLIVR
jgi:agmatine deiminase